MSYEKMGDGDLDYEPCRYGTSRLLFRGPRKELEGDFVAFLGGTETYGKFIPAPYPQLVEDVLGQTCVNLGFVNAGVEFVVSGVIDDLRVVPLLGDGSAGLVQPLPEFAGPAGCINIGVGAEFTLRIALGTVGQLQTGNVQLTISPFRLYACYLGGIAQLDVGE